MMSPSVPSSTSCWASTTSGQYCAFSATMNVVPARRRGREDAVARVERRRHRLLEQHVQTGGERLERDRLVQVVRDHHVDGA